MNRISFVLGLIPFLGTPANLPAQVGPAWDTFSDTWVATDALGRSLPGASECGTPREGKSLGIFYFLWLEGRGSVYDLTKLREASPGDPAYGPVHAFHFWGEPLFGYYRSDDAFVIRKHAQMLADAGVDVIFCDVTNGFIYEPTFLAVCRVFSELRALGQRTPQIAFLANSRHQTVVAELHRRFYAKNLHPDLWFHWKGKPLLLSPVEGLEDEALEFFTLRRSWAWTHPKGWFGDGRDKWPWLDHTPQNFGWHESADRPEQIPVAVAEHPTSNIGRSFHDGRQPPPGQTRSSEGLYFAEQWKRALQVDPELVFVTGWNEWIAQRFLKEAGKAPGELRGQPLQPGDTFFVDAYCQEFSRDIEPMRGGHGDNYYYQLIASIRRYKGVRPLPQVQCRPIRIDGEFQDWDEVTPEFRDTIGDPARREHPGWKGQPAFLDQTGRNDIVAAKVSADASRVSFYARTRQPLTEPGDPGWMLLYLDTDHNPGTGWLGYDFVINRSPGPTHGAVLRRNVGGTYEWSSAVEIEQRVDGNELELAIPRASLGLADGAATIDFKWTDNIPQTGDWSDFTLYGDAAPNDRFNFRAQIPESPTPP